MWLSMRSYDLHRSSLILVAVVVLVVVRGIAVMWLQSPLHVVDVLLTSGTLEFFHAKRGC